MGEVGELLKHLGYGTSVMYALAAFGLFYWFDANASDEAKAALASTMKFKEYDKEQVAAALVEVFDRLYTYPLRRWRAFLRSVLFTLIVTSAFLFEGGGRFLHESKIDFLHWGLGMRAIYLSLAISVVTNILTDYASLFVIRRWLIWCGTRPVIALSTGALLGIFIVYLGMFARLELAFSPLFVQFVRTKETTVPFHLLLDFVYPAIVVFAWLPLFGLGILAIRVLSLSSWAVGKMQWAIRDGQAHPLKAVGYVAAIAVFVIAAGSQTLRTPTKTIPTQIQTD